MLQAVEEFDIRAAATDLFVEAAAKIAGAPPDELVGPNRLVPKLLAEDPKVMAAFEALGHSIAGMVEIFLVEIGEPDLVGDIGSTGFVACAALALVADDGDDSASGLPL